MLRRFFTVSVPKSGRWMVRASHWQDSAPDCSRPFRNGLLLASMTYDGNDGVREEVIDISFMNHSERMCSLLPFSKSTYTTFI